MQMITDGEYVFNPDKLPAAHEWCCTQAAQSLNNGHTVIVANTFVREWEMQPYFELVKDLVPYGGPLDNRIKTWVYHVMGNRGSIHDVPQHVVDKMKDFWEPHVGEIIVDNTEDQS